MFTGLVEDTGAIVSVDERSDARVPGIRPHRIALAELALGDRVNLEVDILAKHVEKLVQP